MLDQKHLPVIEAVAEVLSETRTTLNAAIEKNAGELVAIQAKLIEVEARAGNSQADLAVEMLRVVKESAEESQTLGDERATALTNEFKSSIESSVKQIDAKHDELGIKIDQLWTDVFVKLEESTDIQRKALDAATESTLGQLTESVQKTSEALNDYAKTIVDLEQRQGKTEELSLQVKADVQTHFDTLKSLVYERLALVKDGRDGIDGQKGLDGQDGRDGEPGRDRPIIEPMLAREGDKIDKNTLVAHGGGLFMSSRKANGSPSDDPAGYNVLVNGIADVSFEQTELRKTAMRVALSDGLVIDHTIENHSPIFRGTFKKEVEYSINDIVIKDRKTLIKVADEGDKQWQMFVFTEKGDQGEPGIGLTGADGVGIKDIFASDANILFEMTDGRVHTIELALPDLNDDFDGAAVKSFRGYYDATQAYSSGEIVRMDNSLWLAIDRTTDFPSGKSAAWVQMIAGSVGGSGGGGGDGTVGPQGPRGPVGPQGVPGKPGADGKPGVDGAQGPQGEQGITGADGPQGIQGEVGPQGIQGETGPAGADGAAGVDGAAGPKGDTGDQGIQGEVGPKGDQGVPGEVGAEGPVGPAGAQGEMGATGPTGEVGPKGDTGDQGIPGLGITFIGRVATVGDLPATATQGDLYLIDATGDAWVWSDTAAAFENAGPIVGPTGPQGEAGAAGATGPEGVQGPAGPTAVSADANNTSKLGTDGLLYTPASSYELPIASATRLGGVKVGTGMTVAADGTIATTASTNYVNKNGDVMNGPLRYANSGGVSSFNGQDVYTYYDGTYFRVQLPGSKSGYLIEIATGKVTFSIAPKCVPAPVEDFDLANKAYVDSAMSGSTAYLKTTGGTMTGPITLPTTVQSLTWGASTYNIFGANGGVAIRYGNSNIVNFTGTGATFTQKITTPGTGQGIEFGSGGGYLSKVSAGIGAYIGGQLRLTIGSTDHKSTVPIELPADPTLALQAATKQYADNKPTIVSMPTGGTPPDASLYPNNTLLVEYV